MEDRSNMKYLYRDLLNGQKCCENCDEWFNIEVNGSKKMFCPHQEAVVVPSGYCLAYTGFFKLINKEEGE